MYNLNVSINIVASPPKNVVKNQGDKMFVHGYLMFPDYIAIGMLIGNLVFLISLTAYAITNISDRESARLRIILEDKIRLKIRSSLKEKLPTDFQLI